MDGNCWQPTINRYMNEAIGLGLIQQNNGIVTSLKPTTTDIVSWLANKTGDTFSEYPNVAPKSSLFVFKESFNFLPLKTYYIHIDQIWMNCRGVEIYMMVYLIKTYIRIMYQKPLDILVNKTNLIEELDSGRLGASNNISILKTPVI
ncbi:MAG: hypothetical protein R2741_03480 [Methanolobus sp.]